MKTISIGDHRLDELPNGDVEVVITKRADRRTNTGQPLPACAPPSDVVTLTIPKRDRHRIAEFLLGGLIDERDILKQ